MAAAASSSVLRKEWKKYFLAFNGVVIGVPLAVGGYFVHNLRSDERFREHFQDKYPDLIDTIHEYISIYPEAAPRDDIGEADPAVFKSPVYARVQLKSGKSIVVEAPFDATIQDIHKKALGENASDAVLKVEFQDDAEQAAAAPAQPMPAPRKAAPAPSSVDASVRSTWPTTYTPRNKRKAATDALYDELAASRVKEAALREELHIGAREIDVIEDELRAIDAHKKQLKAQMPRKRFLGLF
ncbi:unnamed protein product [Aphanomyces euteiches]|uniref:Uncharacterized protein n=1 Tax=Aphanomyces euteiches TaxID=100861 RepID=A0A6G0WPM4_9STRA|nr:hypothetical protein Ae201684_013065 [Aphanomyces euteiches]KAH9076469.1 hypothetical protein Ae201684P_010413 [Aphanomyces euteiches]KAH9140379.1 hypothetical protein AeRB84_015370 [Aphanomyces euteiches]KAH9142185.1 hypothetical protein AeRB84_013710 [Aphanomyces euteiches]KAH9148316.1 hypothetical protein AeRB84_008307 [Aphanomyces euteiches]